MSVDKPQHRDPTADHAMGLAGSYSVGDDLRRRAALRKARDEAANERIRLRKLAEEGAAGLYVDGPGPEDAA